MMRLAIVSLGLVTIFALMLSAALLIGRAQPPSERVERLHLTDCDPPCWNGIMPRVSSRGEIEERIAFTFPEYRALSSVNLPFLTWVLEDSAIDVAVDDGLVYSVGIGTRLPLTQMPRLGDVLAVFGSPTCIAIDERSHFSTLYYENAAHQVILQFSAYQPSLLSSVNNFSIGFSYNVTCQKRLAIPWRDFRASRYSFLFTA